MKIVRPILALLALSLAGGTAAAAAPPPSLYSFADLCRLAGAQVLDAPVELRVVSQAQASGPSFAVSRPRDGGRWALVLAGFFACAWVAHRRLASPY
jgi:hypothetical protein